MSGRSSFGIGRLAGFHPTQLSHGGGGIVNASARGKRMDKRSEYWYNIRKSNEEQSPGKDPGRIGPGILR
jgi:hypothetical protein